MCLVGIAYKPRYNRHFYINYWLIIRYRWWYGQRFHDFLWMESNKSRWHLEYWTQLGSGHWCSRFCLLQIATFIRLITDQTVCRLIYWPNSQYWVQLRRNILCWWRCKLLCFIGPQSSNCLLWQHEHIRCRRNFHLLRVWHRAVYDWKHVDKCRQYPKYENYCWLGSIYGQWIYQCR